MTASDSVTITMDIAALPATVYHNLTTTERFALWMGAGATIEPMVGGSVRVPFPDGTIGSGTVVQLAPTIKLAFSWGFEGAPAPLAPGATLVTIDLRTSNRGTRLTLSHHRLPAGAHAGQSVGWRHYLSVLSHVSGAEMEPRIGEGLDAWTRAWSTNDDAERDMALATAWAPGGLFIDQGAVLEGRESLSAYIAGGRQFLSDSRLELVGAFDRCHAAIRFPIRITGPEDTIMRAGTQFADLTPNGMLDRVVTFWDVEAE